MALQTHFKLYFLMILAIFLTACGGGKTGSSTDNSRDNNVAPIANAGVDLAIKEGEILTLTGSLSSDVDGDTLSYEWNQSASAIIVDMGDNTEENLTLDNLEIGNYTFILTVSDGIATHSDQVNVTVNPASVVTGVIKKTGQIKSYNEFAVEILDGSIKDDGFYQRGTPIQYTRSAEGVVTDPVTGLQWQDDAEASSVKKPWVTQANYDAGNYTDTSGDTAVTYCANLTLDGGGWRLPTRLELQGLVNYANVTPAIDSIFENVVADRYWTFTPLASYVDSGWVVSFGQGHLYTQSKFQFEHVRCVREDQ